MSDDKSESTVACDKHNLKIFTDGNESSWLEDKNKKKQECVQYKSAWKKVLLMLKFLD